MGHAAPSPLWIGSGFFAEGSRNKSSRNSCPPLRIEHYVAAVIADCDTHYAHPDESS